MLTNKTIETESLILFKFSVFLLEKQYSTKILIKI